MIAVAAWQFNQAAEAWQDAAGEEIRRASALEECVRAMHSEALPLVGLVMAQPRLDGLHAVRTTAPVAEVESAMAGETVTRLRAGAAAGGPAVIDACRVVEAGLHPVTLIADGPDSSPGAAPEAIAAQGDRAAARGVGVTALGIVMVVIAVGVVARRCLSSRRRTAAGMTSVTACGSAVPPETSGARAHSAPVAKLMAWGLLATMPFVHLLDTAQERRCEALAAIQAVRLSTTAFVSSHTASSSPRGREAEAAGESDALTGWLNASTNSESSAEEAVPAGEHAAAPPNRHLTAVAHRSTAKPM
ncbi:hypothetical protein [Saccharothrix luteola]|uniref:hypothetical protein n=1 Tax=Saccharothrix luteola TaxID=2893018 RepID=UPI001E46A8C7|nr:hypothetical protein [Saccharothrix luteola]MCC8243064.1 hypothetical protein [Saccharothrix luteola]